MSNLLVDIVSKLINLYYLSFRNVISVCLLVFFSANILFAQEDQHKDIMRVVIDPGHGGKDSGTMGTKRYKIYEKDIALSISLILGNYIEKNYSDVEVIYTRKKDVFLELRERTELANNLNADLFISIHCDGFTSPDASGSSVFVMGMSKLKANMEVAMRENSVIYMEDNYQQKYEGFDPKSPESYIVFSLMQNTYLEQSISFAEYIEDQFANRAKRKSRGVKQAPFYVISRVNMPSVLIETGFLTNPKEEDYLNTKAGQDYLASAIFRAFRLYKENIESKLPDNIVDTIKDLSFDVNNKKTTNQTKSLHKEKKNIIFDITFKVQIGTYLKSMLTQDIFQELAAEERIINGTYKYFVGNSSNKEEIDQLKLELQKRGFKGAFVVAFNKGLQISTKEALDLQKKTKNYE